VWRSAGFETHSVGGKPLERFGGCIGCDGNWGFMPLLVRLFSRMGWLWDGVGGVMALVASGSKV
jgi:hypothetical protein